MRGFLLSSVLFLIGCKADREDITSYYERGLSFYEEGIYDSAILNLGIYLKKVPRRKDFARSIIDAHYKLALSYRKLGDIDNELLVYKELYKYIGKTYGYDSKQMAEFYLHVSEAYKLKGLKEKAEYYYELYRKLSER